MNNHLQVFDEADMLLCGSFENQVIRLIDMLRFDEKQLFWSKNSPVSSMEQDSDHFLDSASEFGEEQQSEFASDGEECSEDDVNQESLPEKMDGSNPVRKDWRRIRKHYDRSKQYIFVAATLPVNGKKTAGAVLKHKFPDASWVSGNYLHRHNPRSDTIYKFLVIMFKFFVLSCL